MSVQSSCVRALSAEETEPPMTDGTPWFDRPVLDRLERLAAASARAAENCKRHNCASETVAFHRGAEKAYRGAILMIVGDQRSCAAAPARDA